MKKLLVLIALLLGTVSVYAQDQATPTGDAAVETATATGSGTITGYLTCPLKFTSTNSEMTFTAPVNESASPINKTMDFWLSACGMKMDHTEDPVAGTMHIALSGTVHSRGGSNTSTLSGSWKRNYVSNPLEPISGDVVVDPITPATNNGLDFSESYVTLWDVNYLVLTITSVNTVGQAFTNDALVWDVTVTADPLDF